jgi:hypothetical protein
MGKQEVEIIGGRHSMGGASIRSCSSLITI